MIRVEVVKSQDGRVFANVSEDGVQLAHMKAGDSREFTAQDNRTAAPQATETKPCTVMKEPAATAVPEGALSAAQSLNDAAERRIHLQAKKIADISEQLAAARNEAKINAENFHITNQAYCKQDAIIEGLKRDLAAARENNSDIECCVEIAKLRRAIAKLFDLIDWPEGGDIDGGDFQEWAVDCNILVGEIRTHMCAENCQCSEYYDIADFEKGVTCYRKPQWLIDEQAALATERAHDGP
jgi:hypothetical protein